MNHKAREGDFIETGEELIFDVKGLLHPPDRVIAYLRYIPDKRGPRERAGLRYRKVYALNKRTKLLAIRWPHYLYNSPVFSRQVQAVPLENIRRHYVPSEKLTELRRAHALDEQERLAVDLSETLVRKTGVSISKIGLSGSILVGLHTGESDIDLILYDKNTAHSCHEALRLLLETTAEGFSPLDRSDLRRLYVARNITHEVSFETFVRHEQSKVLQGKFRGVPYFLRCVKEWKEVNENYGAKKYFPVCRLSLDATIADDAESIFTPCTYRLSNVRLVDGGFGTQVPFEIVSFRGRFCEQAKKGDHVVAEGLLERILDERDEIHRLVVGENARDHLIVVEQ
jgi:predicted nucleotidyltransferase